MNIEKSKKNLFDSTIIEDNSPQENLFESTIEECSKQAEGIQIHASYQTHFFCYIFLSVFVQAMIV